MANNINWLIVKAGMSKIEFGKKVFPSVKCVSTADQTAMRQRVDRMCDEEARIQVSKLPKIVEVLNCDYNTLFNEQN